MLTLWKPNSLRRHPNGKGATSDRPAQAPARSLFDDFDRLFDRAFEGIPFASYGWGDQRMSLVPADVHESADAYRVAMDLPGLDREDIEVKLEGETLTVRAERKAESRHESETFLRSERSHGILHRSFLLPSSVDAGKVAATYRNGVLEVTLPKREEARPKAIAVKVT